MSGAEKSIMSLEETVREYFQTHPDARFVNKEVFYYVWQDIRPLLNYDILCPCLLTNQELVSNEEDEKRLRKSSEQPHDKHSTLIEIVRRRTEYGFMILYIYICESITAPGHYEAARLLTEAGETELWVRVWLSSMAEYVLWIMQLR